MPPAAKPLGAAGGGLRCSACETFDPLRSEQVAGWLNGELGRREAPPRTPKAK